MAESLFPHRFTAGCILLGLAIISVGVFLAIQVERQKKWPEAQAQIIESGWSESGEDVVVRIKVEYNVESTTAQSTFLIEDWANQHEQQSQFGPFSSAPETIPQQYKTGAPIQIFYEPGNPENAVLTPGDHWMNAYAILFGLLLVGFGSLSPIYSLLMWRADRLLKVAEGQMREAMTNIKEAEQLLEELRETDPAAYQSCLARHQQMIDEFEQLYGEYKAMVLEVRGEESSEE